jgi:tetratricopeptide (TPR) repeat protein
VRKITTLLGFALGLAWSLALADAADAQRRAAELLREGDLNGALREFDRAVTLEPGSSLVWYNRGLVRRQLGACPAALRDFDRAIALKADYFNAYYQRANCLQTLGNYDRAVEDYTRAVEIPGRIDARFLAYFGRGDAYRRLARLDEAYADYTRVSQLRIDTAALRSLAWIDFYRGRWNDAYREASKYVHDTEAKEPDAAYVVILGTLALRRDARPRDADAFLREWQPKLDASRWPAPVTAYLLGGDARILLAAAREPGERTEARTYLAVDLLAQGKRAEGVKLLQEVLRDGEPGYMEYDAAYHELRRLGLAQPADRRRRR